MSREYLQEAFHAMEILNEEDFQLNDDASLKDIIDFRNNDEIDDILNITDPEVEADSELKDSYIGSVILECTVCHSPIFKAVEDVQIDEESDLANIEDECPICHSQDGFKVVGQVAPFKEEPEIKVEVEEKPESETEIEDEPEVEEESEEKVEESLKEEIDPELTDRLDKIEDKIEEVADQVCSECDPEEEEETSEEVEIQEEPADEETVEKTDDITDSEEEEEPVEESCNKKLEEGRRVSMYDAVTKCLYGINDAQDVKPEASNEHRYNYNSIVPGEKENDIRILGNSPEDFEFAKKVADFYKVPISDIKELHKNQNGSAVGKYYVDITINEGLSSIHEGFEKVDLEMEDKIIHVSEEEKEPVPDAEMVVPVSNELESELNEPEEVSTPAEEPETVQVPEEPIEDEIVGEESPEEKPIEQESSEDDEVDYDIDDFVEESFNYLGETYLKKVYENVDSFKTTSVKSDDSNLIIEGLIKFTSGKEKATQFIFEAHDATKNGKVRFIGENAQISRGKKAFILSGNVQDNRFIAESLNYNYRAKNTDGKSSRLYGTIKVDK